MSQTMTVSRPAPATTPAKMSYEEFLEWADEDTHAEWVNGKAVFMSPVSNLHQDVGGFLLQCLLFFVQEGQLGVVRYESFQMKLGADLPGREPDILFISNERMANLENSYLAGPADLVVEIISPESVHRDTVDKFAEYEAAGVPEYWLIDPLQETALFYQLDEKGLFRSALVESNGLYQCAVLPGFWLNVNWLWQKPMPTLRSVLVEWDAL